MEETFFGFLRFNTMISQMLNIAALLILIIPLESVPVRF
jgi:hypothetical protein